MMNISFFARPARISTITVDGDLDLAGYKLKTDHIAESTAAHGVHVDNTLAPDGAVNVGGAMSIIGALDVDHIGEKTASHGVVCDNTLKVDHIGEMTEAHNIIGDNILEGFLGLTCDKVTCAASDTLQIQNTAGDLEQSNLAGAYTKIKTQALAAGQLSGSSNTLRIKWSMKMSNATTGYAKIYRNGVAVGVEKTTSSLSYVAQSDDVAGWSAGDLIQLYIKNDGGGGTTMYVKELRIYATTTAVISAGTIAGTGSNP